MGPMGFPRTVFTEKAQGYTSYSSTIISLLLIELLAKIVKQLGSFLIARTIGFSPSTLVIHHLKAVDICESSGRWEWISEAEKSLHRSREEPPIMWPFRPNIS